MRRRVFESAFGHQAASAINLVNHNGQTIKFSEVLGRQNNASSGVDYFGSIGRLHDNLIVFASEEHREGPQLVHCNLRWLHETAEDVVRRGAPEEVFRGHQVLRGGLADIVADEVVFDSAPDFAPEEQLGRHVHLQLFEAQLELANLLEVESASVHLHVLQVACQLCNLHNY